MVIIMQCYQLSRKYRYRIGVAENEQVHLLCTENPPLWHFAERPYMWLLPNGFDPHKAQDICRMFEVCFSLFSFCCARGKICPFFANPVVVCYMPFHADIFCQLLQYFGIPPALQRLILTLENYWFFEQVYCRQNCRRIFRQLQSICMY